MGSSKTPKVDLVARRGDTFSKNYLVRDRNGNVADLTGYVFVSQVRSDTESVTVITTPTITVTSAVEGAISLTMTAAQTAAWTLDVMVYDVQATAPDGVVTTIVAGNIKVEKDVTR